MVISATRLSSKDQTGEAMNRLINRYHKDVDKIFVRRGNRLVPFSSLPLWEAFRIVGKMPYKRDKKPIEIIQRPVIVARGSQNGIDCKKKAILLASYLKRRNIPYRLIASSRKRNKRIHHVFPQMGIRDQWLNMDATYSHNRPFERKMVTRAEVLQ